MVACPKCKTLLENNRCLKCNWQYKSVSNIPLFFTGSKISDKYLKISQFYNNLYDNVNKPWQKIALRDEWFYQFFASLVEKYQPKRFLEIGCGDGNLLQNIKCSEIFGLDLSVNALKIVSTRIKANVCCGFAEELPFPDQYFNVIATISVMTHFIDDKKATNEICRTLTPLGYYIVGIYMRPSWGQRFRVKMEEFVKPYPNPVKFARWIVQKITAFCKKPNSAEKHDDYDQPIKIFYNHNSLVDIFNVSGFKVVDFINKRKNPQAPLPGHHYRIYILQKS